jgi:hypothetical protein
MFTKRLFTIQANWFAKHEGLMPNRQIAAFAHDAIHSVFGIGVSLEDEELALNLEQSLRGLQVSTHMQAKVTDALAALINSDVELFMELQTFIESAF